MGLKEIIKICDEEITCCSNKCLEEWENRHRPDRKNPCNGILDRE